eukprot:UN16369
MKGVNHCASKRGGKINLSRKQSFPRRPHEKISRFSKNNF